MAVPPTVGADRSAVAVRDGSAIEGADRPSTPDGT
jgi:hypothetical protein